MPIVLNGSGPITGVTSLNTTVSDTEIGYLDGVTSALQTQINTAGGLVKIVDSTFSAQSSVSVNDCFSSTYANYMIISRNNAAAGGPGISFRLRVSGTDASAANYNYNELGSSTVTSVVQAQNQTFWYAGYASPTPSTFIMYVFSPNIAEATYYHSDSSYVSTPGSTALSAYRYVGRHTLSTQYTGFTIYPDTSTITGNLRVYGIRN